MERSAHKSRSFREAEAWELTQYHQMTPAERIQAAHALRARICPLPQKDVRECHRRR
jgi:hypothetical protein